MRLRRVKSYERFSIKIHTGSNRFIYPGLISLLLILIFFLPFRAQAAIDWHLEWIKGDSSAQLFVYNPESREQSFVLETGDRVRLDNITVLDLALDNIILDDIVRSFDLLIGEDVKFRLAPRARRTKIPVTVYIVDNAILGSPTFQSQAQTQGQTQAGPSTRAIIVTPRVPTAPAAPVLIYRRVVDHEYDAEQLIRTGQKIGALYQDVQEVLLFLFQRITTLASGAQAIWEVSFPELSTAVQPTPSPPPSDILIVTFVTSNPTFVPREVTLSAGDILEPLDPQFPRVVVGEDVAFFVEANTESAAQLVQVYRITSAGPLPSQNTIYSHVISHDSRLAKVIQIGDEEGFGSAAIQNVILHIMEGAPLTGEGSALWQRLSLPRQAPPGTGLQACLGPFLSTTSTTTTSSTGINLLLLAAVLIPFRALASRRIRR